MKIIFLGVLILLATASAFAGNISNVSVRDKNFQVVHTLEDQRSLQQFEKIWKAKKKINESRNPQWLYKIDIGGKGQGDRWLYDPTGFVQVLSKMKTPVYQIPDVEVFNKLLGAHNMPQEPSR